MPLVTDLPSHFYSEYSVQAADIDLHQHVNNKVYLSWMEELAWQHSLAVGINAETHQAHQKIMVVKQHQLNYHHAAKRGDILLLKTWVDKPIGCCQRLRHYQFIRKTDQAQVFSAQTLWVCMSTTTQKAAKLPKAFNQPYFPG